MSIPYVDVSGRSSPLACTIVSVEAFDSLMFVCLEPTPSVANLNWVPSVEAPGPTLGNVPYLLATSI